jgi:hypothetical protein
MLVIVIIIIRACEPNHGRVLIINHHVWSSVLSSRIMLELLQTAALKQATEEPESSLISVICSPRHKIRLFQMQCRSKTHCAGFRVSVSKSSVVAEPKEI